MSKQQAEVGDAFTAYGRVQGFFHVGGYSFERGFRDLEALLEEGGGWEKLGFSTRRELVDSFSEGDKNVQLVTEHRKKIAKLLHEKDVPNNVIAKVLNVDRKTIDRDLGTNVHPKTEKNKINQRAIGTNVPPSVSGAAAAKAVERVEAKAVAAQERVQLRTAYDARAERGGVADDLEALSKKKGGGFSVIYADPPWSFKVYSGKGKERSAERHYDTMTLDDIRHLPVEDLAADDCALFLWSVMPELPGALQVIRSWGFEYKTCAFTWVKQNRGGQGLFTGMGYWTRANAEVCLLATRGSPKRLALDVPQVVLAPVGQHSAKPDEVRTRIGRLLAGPYLELFGRSHVEGWTVWGNEVEVVPFEEAVG